MARRRILVVAGTRPEAIKLAPLILALGAQPDIALTTCVTAQHRELLDQAFTLFGIVPDVDLALMRHGQSITDFAGAAITGLRRVIDETGPDLLIVQGDTATTMAASMAAYWTGVPIAHVEAGLRSGDLARPFPEEGHRAMIGRIATLHFAPTHAARDALVAEGIAPTRIHLTGNTGIDALHLAVARIDGDHALAAALDARFAVLDRRRPLVLVTAHRRENHGAPMTAIADAVARLAGSEPIEVLVPLHPAAAAREPLARRLADVANVRLVEPLDYPAFVHVLRRAQLVLTDSGGVQEEAPALGCPTLVLRDVTERPEGVAAGAARLVGTDAGAIVAAASGLLRDERARARMAAPVSPYGDGRATQRIVAAIADFLAVNATAFA